MESQRTTTRKTILNAALDIIEREGIRAATQPRIARETGLRQSHLTYYFPRKADLYIALLEASHERADRRSAGQPEASLEDLLMTLFFEPERMRFFLSIILEVGDDSDLRRVLAAHANGLDAFIASCTARESGDPGITAFVDELRGLGIRKLVDQSFEFTREDLRNRAKRFGLELG